MTQTISIADALRELDRYNNLLEQRCTEISKYCSKAKTARDSVEGQQAYVKQQAQSAEDIILVYKAIKLAVAKANLETTFEFNGKSYSIAEAILYKHVLEEMYKRYYNSFHDLTAQKQLSEFRMSGLTQEDIVKLDRVPELYYDPKEIQKKKEDLLELMSRLDSLIDKANHQTMITF